MTERFLANFAQSLLELGDAPGGGLGLPAFGGRWQGLNRMRGDGVALGGHGVCAGAFVIEWSDLARKFETNVSFNLSIPDEVDGRGTSGGGPGPPC